MKRALLLLVVVALVAVLAYSGTPQPVECAPCQDHGHSHCDDWARPDASFSR